MLNPFNRKVIECITFILILTVTIAGLYTGGFLTTTTTTPRTPLTNDLALEPTNGTVLQGHILNAILTANYIAGTKENVTLTADTPNGITCTFATTWSTPTESFPFKSTLQFCALPNTASGIYEINVTSSIKSGRTNSTTFMLTVLNAFINVSGTVTADFDNEIVPTVIAFENTETHEKFTASVLTTPITGVPARPLPGLVQTGRYWLMLPNMADYAVTCSWMRVPLPGAHFDRDAIGSFNGGGLSVNCGVGGESLTGANF